MQDLWQIHWETLRSNASICHCQYHWTMDAVCCQTVAGIANTTKSMIANVLIQLDGAYLLTYITADRRDPTHQGHACRLLHEVCGKLMVRAVKLRSCPLVDMLDSSGGYHWHHQGWIAARAACWFTKEKTVS